MFANFCFHVLTYNPLSLLGVQYRQRKPQPPSEKSEFSSEDEKESQIEVKDQSEPKRKRLLTLSGTEKNVEKAKAAAMHGEDYEFTFYRSEKKNTPIKNTRKLQSISAMLKIVVAKRR